MRNGKRELSGAPLPVTLVYGTALTCGVLAAIAVQIQLSRAGFDFISLWQNLFSSRAMQLRTAGPWWAIAGMAFIVSGAVAAALSRVTLPWRRLRLLRWAAGAVVVSCWRILAITPQRSRRPGPQPIPPRAWRC